MVLTRQKAVQVCLISDTYGVVDQRIVQLVKDCDAVVHAGDIGNGGVLESLQPRQKAIVAIKGNNDVPRKWPRDHHRRLSALAETAAVELPGGRLVAVHGDRHNPARRCHAKLREAYADARAVVYGQMRTCLGS